MKISTRGRYALRLMLDLALCPAGTPVCLRDIARRQEISEKYLEQIISMLNKAGFVQSIRGAQGGYLLKKEPSEYTVGFILGGLCGGRKRKLRTEAGVRNCQNMGADKRGC